jgi:hypothetical protein
MLTLDLARLSDNELKNAVIQYCTPLGAVGSVTMHRPADQIGYAVALVSMSTADAANQLLAGIGDAKFGSTVVVRLEQEKNAVPVSLLTDTDLSAQMYDLHSCVSNLTANRQSPAQSSEGQTPIDILLVEDDPADVRMTREALRAAGISSHLHVVEDGMAGLTLSCSISTSRKSTVTKCSAKSKATNG